MSKTSKKVIIGVLAAGLVCTAGWFIIREYRSRSTPTLFRSCSSRLSTSRSSNVWEKRPEISAVFRQAGIAAA